MSEQGSDSRSDLESRLSGGDSAEPNEMEQLLAEAQVGDAGEELDETQLKPGQDVTLRAADGRAVQGTFYGLTQEGQLHVRYGGSDHWVSPSEWRNAQAPSEDVQKVPDADQIRNRLSGL